MRILQVIPNFRLGGVQKAGCVLGAAMARAGHEVRVAGRTGGPRFDPAPASGQTHEILQEQWEGELDRLIEAFEPDVCHVHVPHFEDEPVPRLLEHRASGGPVVVVTPVFGRPPHRRDAVGSVRTCCVGVYTFYRFCRWMGLDAAEALSRGVVYAPLTPFEPPATAAGGPLDASSRRALRRELGLEDDSFVVGRIGRDTPGKWHRLNAGLIDALLRQHEGLAWLSVGYPAARGLARLERRWGPRFRNLPQTPDYDLITRVIQSMDVQLFFSRQGECFAASICEAAGLGVPTVAVCNPLRDNGQSEQVIDGVTGWLVGSARAARRVIGRLIEDPPGLEDVRRRAAAHAASRWHVDRVAGDLLALYEHWTDGRAGEPEYLDLIRREHDQFASDYCRRMTALVGRTWLDRALWRVLMRLVASWTLFRIGRSAKNIVERWMGRGR